MALFVRGHLVRGATWLAWPLALTHNCRIAQCRDLENHHHEKLLEIAINTLEKILKGEMDEDLPDEVRAVSTGRGAGGMGNIWRGCSKEISEIQPYSWLI